MVRVWRYIVIEFNGFGFVNGELKSIIKVEVGGEKVYCLRK